MLVLFDLADRPMAPAEDAALDETWAKIQSACGGVRMVQVHVEVDVSISET